MGIFVLVHGAFHGGWCYSRVAARLRAQQHAVYTPTLSGVGERAHLAGQSINLSTHVRDIVAMIEANDLNDVILCGHSYGGMVITGVAGQIAERIKALVYVDGCVPEDGQSLVDIIGPQRTLRMLEDSGATGVMMAPPAASFFGVNAADAEWVDSLLTPHPIATLVQKLRYTGKEALVKHRTYVLCERYKSINHPTYARVKNQPGWRAVSIDSGHDLMIDDPDALTKVLLEELKV